MKLKWNGVIIIAAMVATTLGTMQSSAQKQNDEQLLHVRETVWRAWFAGDTKTLEDVIPPESIVMSGGEEKWKNQADVLHSAAEFHANGGKLVRLEFPSHRSSALRRCRRGLESVSGRDGNKR